LTENRSYKDKNIFFYINTVSTSVNFIIKQIAMENDSFYILVTQYSALFFCLKLE